VKAAPSYEELNIQRTQTDPCKNSISITALFDVPRELIRIIYAVHIGIQTAWDIKPAWVLDQTQTAVICFVMCWIISARAFELFLLIFIWSLGKGLPNNSLFKKKL
jgi:hypothetical protein